jgi:hypothetical protein
MPLPISPSELNALLPLACQWAEDQELLIVKTGTMLTPAQFQDAITLGLTHPQRVRLLRVPQIPLPEDPCLREACERVKLITPSTAGLSLRYGIFIREDWWTDRSLIAHELTHTLQYERLGSIENFLRAYLAECISPGYPNGPLEQEAIRSAARFE